MTRWLEALLCAALVMTGGLIYDDFFATRAFLLPLLLAAVLGAGSGALRRPLGLTLAVSFAGFALLVAYTAMPDTLWRGLPTPRTGLELLSGIAGGWARMLTVGLSADVRGELLVTPMVLTWAAAFTAVTIAVRTRSVLGPVLPPLVAFIIALLFVAARYGSHLDLTAAFLGLSLTLALLRANRGPTLSWRLAANRTAIGVPAIAIIVGLAIAGTTVLPLATAQDRFDPRDLKPPPLRPSDTTTPLSGIKRQLLQEDQGRLFTVRLTGESATADRIRTTALEQFDGAVWTSADEFMLAGHELTPDPEGDGARPVSAEVVVDQLTGPYLPVIGWPAEINIASDAAVGFCNASGVLMSASPLTGLNYRFDAALSPRDDTGLRRALPSSTKKYRRYTALPDDTPTRLGELARELTKQEQTAYGQLTSLEKYLRTLPYSLETAPGHSYAAINRLLAGTDAHDTEGYAEQHASAFAVLARALDLPSRVAIGYRLHDSKDGTFTVTPRDAHAWAEVHFDGYGWVAFEPTDFTAEPLDQRSAPDTDAPGPPELEPPPTIPAGPPQAWQGGGQPGADIGALIRKTALITVIVLLLLGPVAVTTIVAEKHRRRWRRRRGGTPTARVLGAWQETVDRLVERGLRLPPTWTANEVAADAAGLSDVVAPLATLATEAVFAPTPADESTAERAWRLEATLRGRLYPKRLSWPRLQAMINPQPLIMSWRFRRRELLTSRSGGR